MKLSRATTAEAFISKATSGEMKKEKKPNTNLSSVRFTDTQWKLIYKVLEISNISTKTALFNTIAEFMRSDFNYLDYVDYLDFITGVGVSGSGKAYPIQKNRAYEFFSELYEDYRVNWVNIRVRGVIILAILHYAKNKLNLDLNELLEGILDE
ncbi:hypothetical protein P9J86_06965 [Glaesserella parasuis]|uniref:hypothetical protein n=1 Tax=Glaesserella parasuis TaxID=738 RepID=UPI0024373EAF|nr:hypothetical protein [Glaesserella parasuis]MDG6261631.1 hypothetical protein [Glaesserella parasuis]MDG6323052.1 hypothetical protein [Glaesserella parasuis]